MINRVPVAAGLACCAGCSAAVSAGLEFALRTPVAVVIGSITDHISSRVGAIFGGSADAFCLRVGHGVRCPTVRVLAPK